jgi:uroporphyrinogen decarboxylase
MNSRDRVIRTLEFNTPDRIPVDLWVLPAARQKYGGELDRLLDRHERDIVQFDGPLDLSFGPEAYRRGSYTDLWGCGWSNLQSGIVGEVKNPALAGAGIDMIGRYRPPADKFRAMWNEYRPKLDIEIGKAAGNMKFTLGGWINIFERMQFLRGTEDLYCDIAGSDDEFFMIRDIVSSFYKSYIKEWLGTGVDGMVFGDDWGSQRSLLISPDVWRLYFKPVYKELIDMVRDAGKYVFFHSDGYIMDLYQEFIDLGVNAVNSQLWCMGVGNVAERFAGRITFWGEISRQDILPSGSPDDIKAAADMMKKFLFINGGGLIGQSETGGDVPLENIEAVLRCWNDQ